MVDSEPKKQHTVPRCYLREFRDPLSDSSEPFVWIFDKNGRNPRRDKVKNILAVNHAYTVRVNGKPDYTIEKNLADIEGQYTTVFREKINKRLPLTRDEQIILCLFVAIMMQRTMRFKKNIDGFLSRVVEMMEGMESAHGAPHIKSVEVREMMKEFHQRSIFDIAPETARILMQMSMAFICPPIPGPKFITSDDPCNLFNPKTQWEQGFLRNPGLAQRDVQLTLPLSPDILLCLSWSNLRGYIEVSSSRVQDQNRMIRGFADRYFISHSRKVRKSWFMNKPLDPWFYFEFLVVHTRQFVQRIWRWSEYE